MFSPVDDRVRSSVVLARVLMLGRRATLFALLMNFSLPRPFCYWHDLARPGKGLE